MAFWAGEWARGPIVLPRKRFEVLAVERILETRRAGMRRAEGSTGIFRLIYIWTSRQHDQERVWYLFLSQANALVQQVSKQLPSTIRSSSKQTTEHPTFKNCINHEFPTNAVQTKLSAARLPNG